MNEPPIVNYYTDSEARRWNMLVHLSALSGYVTGLGFILGPILVWQIQKDKFPSVDFHGKEAVNFQISCFIYGILSVISLFVGVGLLLVPAVAIFHLVFTVIGAIKANDGIDYRYPLTFRFL
jgi:uncharacterized Tic20 family protein